MGQGCVAEGLSGNVADGKKLFKKCKSCHSIISDDGIAIEKGGKAGPNLWGLSGRVSGTTSYRYGSSIVKAGEAGLVWEKEEFVEYVANPKAFLVAKLKEKSARSKMSYKLKKASDAVNIWAYLVSHSPNK
jgi:cytochrome c